MKNPAVEETPGEHTVRCHIMLKVCVEYTSSCFKKTQHNIVFVSFKAIEIVNDHIFFLSIFLSVLHPQGNFDISVNLTTDTINDLKRMLAIESGIPAHALHYQ